MEENKRKSMPVLLKLISLLLILTSLSVLTMMTVYPLAVRIFCNLSATIRLSSYSARPLATPVVPPVTFAFIYGFRSISTECSSNNTEN